jgi:hypothetical protein
MPEERVRRRMVMTVPASSPNLDYAVRQLFGGDHNLEPTVTAMVEVSLTPEQELRLETLDADDLKALRNGPNAVSINSVEVWR